MAPISKFIPFLFLTTLLLSLQINARDSQFFSKVSHVNNNFKETEVPKNEEPLKKPEQQPVFIPETENSYGLYGHESGQNPPTTTTTPTPTPTTYQPYKTETEEKFNKYPNKNYYNYNKDFYRTNQNEMSDTRLAGTPSSNNNYFYNNKDAFGDKQNQLSDTKYTEGGYNSMENQNKKKKYYYNNNAANDKNSFQNNAVNNKYYGERQGISDTRFMEGGKYFYDVDSEKYNPTLYGGSSRGVNSENMVNNRGYFGNNNVNSYEKKNSMEGYQNQEEFEDVQEDFEP
ncbi:protein E6-like [Gastrolobium bilobum]|uniref:protein E6-like n=1 Tax=Gastrolobium bilobum TaxID=150636 RepID=UPI002AB1C77A|nr:protein E6-like [Gastrolobium bilobum]